MRISILTFGAVASIIAINSQPSKTKLVQPVQTLQTAVLLKQPEPKALLPNAEFLTRKQTPKPAHLVMCTLHLGTKGI